MRCDGGAEIGAGHVARCLPLAGAFRARGWATTFVGRYDGLAAWLLDSAGHEALPGEPGSPCGLVPGRFEAALVDSYELPSAEVCELAAGLPIATLGEAARCEQAGVLLDYHVDRRGDAPESRLLPGPRYAPLDPDLAGAGRAADPVASVLITVGGSDRAREHLPALRAAVSESFPDAVQVVPQAGAGQAGRVRLSELLGQVDLAVSAAGLTAYELACAGIPMVIIAIVGNQRRVLSGMRAAGLGISIDLDGGESLDSVRHALDRLLDPVLRREQADLGRSIFDGRGAERAVDALLERWDVPNRSPSMLEAL